MWNLANKWLDECRDSHKDCEISHVAKTLLTRLLDIGSNNEEVRLVTTHSLLRRTQYATLSYCWSSKPFMTLTRDNLADFLNSIPFERLSTTFKDAITAARNLRFRYLWVCSLTSRANSHRRILAHQSISAFRDVCLSRNLLTPQ